MRRQSLISWSPLTHSSPARTVHMNALFSSLRLVAWQPALHRLEVMQLVRHNQRYPLRFPSETKRYRKVSWDKRISTPNGKVMIMKRILKRHQVLCGF